MDKEREFILAKITRRRRQILVHSYIYYRLDGNIISDSVWSTWAKELYDLQLEYPDLAAIASFSEAFKDFDYSTGCNLPLDHPWVVSRATLLYRAYCERNNG